MEGDAGFAGRRVGSILKGKYSLERLIGVGGMASVYRGSHRNGHRVAIKVLHPGLAAHAELRDRFLREGYLANKVHHPGAVRVLDDDVADDGSVFLVMELLEGETLAARWERHANRLAQRDVAALADQLLDVLAAAHAQGVVHRDIKPDNLFMTDDGELKVLDFGIARLRDPAGAAAASVTRTGSMLGTPAYMPPEQVLGRSREIDGQTDIWSVGATMFAVMSGHYVHDAETVEELLVYAGSRPARLLGSVAPDIAPALAAVVDRALAFDKAGRWPDARAMQGAIQEASARAFGTSVSSACPMQLAATIPAPVPCPLVPTQIAAPHTGSTTAVVVETPHRSGAPRRIMRMGLSAALIVLLAIGADVVVVANGGGRVSPSSRGTEPTSLAPPATSADMAAPSAAPVVASAALDPIAAPIAVGELPPAATVPRRAPLHGPTLRQQPTRREPPSRSRW